MNLILKRLPSLSVSMPQLLLLVAVYLAATQNLSFWREVLEALPPTNSLHQSLFLAGLALVLSCALLVCLSLLTPWRLLKPGLALLLITASVCSYFMDNFRTVIDEAMIVNTVQTDAREAAELVVPAFWLHCLLQGLLPAALVMRMRLPPLNWKRDLLQRLLLAAAGLLVMILVIGVGYKDFSLWAREHREIRTYLNPSYPINSAFKFVKTSMRSTAIDQPEVIGGDARRLASPGKRPLVVILVIGETARSANFQLEGYARATNPELSAIQDLIRFPGASSCGTSTAISVPCLFSRLGRRGYDKYQAQSQENLLDVVKRSGVEVLWLDNNSGCKGVCARVDFEDLAKSVDPKLCKIDGCYDGILLKSLAEKLKGPQPDRLIVLHQKGSHGPAYYKRYPPEFRRFMPDCAQDAVQNCSREAIVNAYDNTILYTDHVIAELIASLKRNQPAFDSVVLYVSDHGESLGEEGLYLHGLPYALAPVFQKQVPFFAWFSESAATRRGVNPACLPPSQPVEASHDNVFDTVLGLFQIQTQIYQPQLDLFGSCKP